MIDNLTPGQNIRCTITAEPRTEDMTQTITRLMRQDPAISKRLRKAQNARRKHMHIYIRGGRRWHQRQRSGKIAHVKNGESWTMAYSPLFAGDLKAVEPFIKVEAQQ